jgi:GrpB-like predicted nucleotidyltransferase (UPF0157 family)
MVSEDPVVLVPYEEAWPSLFEEERTRIEGAVGPWVEEIEHIGSTAVPGLAAKPVIDIMVGVRSLEDTPALVARLETIGYEYVPELERQMPFRRYFRKLAGGRRTHQIHLVERSTQRSGTATSSSATTCGRTPRSPKGTAASSTKSPTVSVRTGPRTQVPKRTS